MPSGVRGISGDCTSIFSDARPESAAPAAAACGDATCAHNGSASGMARPANVPRDALKTNVRRSITTLALLQRQRAERLRHVIVLLPRRRPRVILPRLRTGDAIQADAEIAAFFGGARLDRLERDLHLAVPDLLTGSIRLVDDAGFDGVAGVPGHAGLALHV